MKRTTLRAFALAFVLTVTSVFAPGGIASASDADRPIARTKSGPVVGRYVSDAHADSTGAASSRVAIYKGIPFAEPPVGPLRWQPPQPVRKWSGVREAHGDPPGCMQSAASSRLPWTEEFMHHGPVNEDCLYLNVWTPAKGPLENLPVLVFIHGGGFTEGSVAVPLYDGAALARKGIVVVTLNYRLGVFGFLAHPELTKESPHAASGNYGLLDQIAALRWVRDNAAAFGGDRKRVTVAGQSAGAMSAYLLTASPLSNGLFSATIVQSGPGALASFGVDTARSLAVSLKDGETAGRKFAEGHGGTSLEQLREMDAKALLAKPGDRMGAVVDGWFLPAHVDAIYKQGRQTDVPLLIGMMADEASAFPGYDAKRAAVLRKRSIDAFGVLLKERASTSKKPAYVYYFERAIPWPEQPQFAAFHSGELPYTFDNLELLPRPWTVTDRALARTVSSYWVSFASKGDPNAASLPAWPAFAGAGSPIMVFGDTASARPLSN